MEYNGMECCRARCDGMERKRKEDEKHILFQFRLHGHVCDTVWHNVKNKVLKPLVDRPPPLPCPASNPGTRDSHAEQFVYHDG